MCGRAGDELRRLWWGLGDSRVRAQRPAPGKYSAGARYFASLPHCSLPDALLTWGLVPQKRPGLFPLGIASHAFPPAWAALALM